MERVTIAGRVWNIDEVKRDRSPLDEQLESLAEDYEGFDLISVSHGVIRFYYARKKQEDINNEDCMCG